MNFNERETAYVRRELRLARDYLRQQFDQGPPERWTERNELVWRAIECVIKAQDAFETRRDASRVLAELKECDYLSAAVGKCVDNVRRLCREVIAHRVSAESRV
jgi:hypothetical protein